MEKLDQSQQAAKRKTLASLTSSTTSQFSKNKRPPAANNADRTLRRAHLFVASAVTVIIVISCSTLWMSSAGVKSCFNQEKNYSSYRVIRCAHEFYLSVQLELQEMSNKITSESSFFNTRKKMYVLLHFYASIELHQ